MFSRLKSIFKPRLKAMNVISINKKTILQNFTILQQLQPQSGIFPILKSNAYGHGLLQMVKILRRLDVPYLAVDSFPEYQIVKKYSNKQILLIWETMLENYDKFDHRRVAFCVYNIWTLSVLGNSSKEKKIHIFFNTGMNREWISEDNLPKFLDELKNYPNITVEGVMSHLHSADDIHFDGIEEQVKKFKTMYHMVLDYGHAPLRRHIGNSAGIFKIHGEFFNAWRPGLALYGYNPLRPDDPAFKKAKSLTPALSISSRIISLPIARPGEWVSYHQTYKPYDRELIATIPFGYAEWLDRHASGGIFFKRGKKYIQQVGTICMNLCCCKIDDPLAKIGDKVEIISPSSTAKNSIQALADASGTIVYESLVRLDKTIRREII